MAEKFYLSPDYSDVNALVQKWEPSELLFVCQQFLFEPLPLAKPALEIL